MTISTLKATLTLIALTQPTNALILNTQKNSPNHFNPIKHGTNYASRVKRGDQNKYLQSHFQRKPAPTTLWAFNSDLCKIEPDITTESINSKPIKKIIIERTLITALSTMILALILPTIKGMGLTGKLSVNPNIRKSILAIGPIVAFTVNAPQLLNTIWNHLLSSNSNQQQNNNFKVMTLAILKHLWIWGPENDLNTLSTSINQATNENSISIIPRKFSHILREALLIKCMSKSECETIAQKVKSYAEQALL